MCECDPFSSMNRKERAWNPFFFIHWLAWNWSISHRTAIKPYFIPSNRLNKNTKPIKAMFTSTFLCRIYCNFIDTCQMSRHKQIHFYIPSYSIKHMKKKTVLSSLSNFRQKRNSVIANCYTLWMHLIFQFILYSN